MVRLAVDSAMDFVTKTLSSFSLSSSPFSQGALLDAGEEGTRIWKIYEGTIKKDGRPCTLFVFDATDLASRGQQPLAENMSAMLRKLRIPGLLKLIDSYTTSSGQVTIATEPVRPVSARLNEFSPMARQWALQTVLDTLDNLHKHTKCAHCNIQLSSLFETANGEWALGGFELAGFVPSDSPPLWSYGSLLPQNEQNCPPEIQRQGWQAVSSGGDRAAFAVDSWQFGRLARTMLGDNMPAQIQPIISSLMASGKRSTIVKTAASKEAFETPLVRVTEWASNPYALNEIEFSQLLITLNQCYNDIPAAFVGGKVLPELSKAVDAGKGGIDGIRLALALCCRLENPQFQNVAVPVIMKLFASMDRAVRLELLRSLPSFIDKVPDRDVQSKVFPAMGTGFVDTEAVIRRESLQAVKYIAPKLSSRQINGDLLRMLARTNSDAEEDIRAATIVLLCDLSELMDKSTRSSVIVTALARGLRDPTTTVRMAALQGLQKTSQHFTPKECAEKLVGPAASALLDTSLQVRQIAQRVFDMLIDRIKKASEELGDVGDRPSSAASNAITASAAPSAVSSIINLWGSSEAPAVPSPSPALPASQPSAVAAVVAPATENIAVKSSAGTGIVQETAVFQSNWDWEPEPAPKPKTRTLRPMAAKSGRPAAKPAAKPTAKPAVKPAARPAQQAAQRAAPPASKPAAINLEPDDDTEGWDW